MKKKIHRTVTLMKKTKMNHAQEVPYQTCGTSKVTREETVSLYSDIQESSNNQTKPSHPSVRCQILSCHLASVVNCRLSKTLVLVIGLVRLYHLVEHMKVVSSFQEAKETNYMSTTQKHCKPLQ